jgi:hypothetical protein
VGQGKRRRMREEIRRLRNKRGMREKRRLRARKGKEEGLK